MKSIESFYKDRYSRLSKDTKLSPFSLAKAKEALKILKGSPKRILEFGCNVGTTAQLFTEKGHEVVGVDISESAIAIARRQVTGVTFEQIESENTLPFPDESFDACYLAFRTF